MKSETKEFIITFVNGFRHIVNAYSVEHAWALGTIKAIEMAYDPTIHHIEPSTQRGIWHQFKLSYQTDMP